MQSVLVRACVVIAFVVAAADSSAQQPSTSSGPTAQSTTEEGDESSLRVKETVVVTATRSEAEIDKTPLSATVITSEELKARPVQSIDQQLTLTEGVHVQRFQGFSATDSNVYLRGFNSGSRTLVLLDGQPMNDAYANSVNWTGIPTGQVESIEVARGPFSSLYGGNALGGVINIRTRPVDRRALEATAEYGTYDSTRLTARFADRFWGRLGVTMGGERFDTNGYNSRRFTAMPGTGTGTPVTGPIPSLTTAGARTAIIGEGGRNWLTRHAARVSGEFQATPSTIYSVQYLLMQYRYGYEGYTTFLRDSSGNPIDSGAVVYNDGGTLRRLSVTPNSFMQGPGEQHSNFYSGTYQHAFVGGSTLRIDAGLNHIPSYEFRSLAGGNTLTSGPGTLTDGTRATTHANVQYNRAVQQHVLTIGGETRHEIAENAQFPLTNWTNTDARGTQNYVARGQSISQSAYVQDQISIRDNIMLVVGGRYDFWEGYDGVSDSFSASGPRMDYPSRRVNQVSGKAALGYTMPGNWNLRLSVGNAFRNPNVYELYATSVTASGIVLASNPALAPETVTSWEAGVRKRVGRWTSVDAAYFQNHIRDLIYRQTDLDQDPTGNYRINMNAGRGRTRGMELAFRQELGAGLQFRGTYTYTDAIITSNPGNPAIVGKRVTTIPDHIVAGQLLGAHGKTTGSLSGRYVGLVYSTDTNTDTTKGVPGSYSPYFTMDASVSYALTPHVEPFVSSENLLNRRYYIFYLSPGRTVFGGVRVRL